MTSDSVLIRVADDGRLSIPAKQRELLGLEEGGIVVARVEDGELRIRPAREVLASLQAKVREYADNSESAVDLLLEMRREEALREELEMDLPGSSS